MKLPAQVKKTFNDIPCVNVSAFREARAFIEKIITGEVDPARTEKLYDKAVALMNSRKSKGKSRPARHLKMTAEAAVIRRPSGLLVPPKYK